MSGFFDDLVQTVNPVNLAKGFFDATIGVGIGAGKDIVSNLPRALYESGAATVGALTHNQQAEQNAINRGANALSGSSFFSTISPAGAKAYKAGQTAKTNLGQGLTQLAGADVQGLAAGGLKYGVLAAPALGGAEVAGSRGISAAISGVKGGAAFGGLNALSQDNPSLETFAHDIGLGAITGGALGVAIPAAIEGVKGGVKGYQNSPTLASQRGSVPLELTPEELNMGKALGMSEADVVKAKANEPAPKTLGQTRNMRLFDYTDTPMTSGEKAALAALEGNKVDISYTAASNELRQLSKEAGHPEAYKMIIKQISDQKMSQVEATKYLEQGLEQMRNSGTNAKIRMGVVETPPKQTAVAALTGTKADVNGPTPLVDDLAGGVAPPQKGKLPPEAAPDPLQRGNAFNETKRFPEQLKTSFQDLVNNNHAAPIEGKLAAEPFKVLDSEGTGAFVQAQSGATGGAYDALRTYFDNKFKQLKDNKINLNYQKDYLPQIWENSPEEIAKVFTDKSLSSKPSFTKSKVIEDYQYGLDHGLTPKFETVSDLVGWYETSANRAIANKQFITSLIENKRLLPADEAPKSWKVLDNEMVPTDRLYKVDPRLQKVLGNYLEAAHVEGLNTLSRFATRTKNIALGAGVPLPTFKDGRPALRGSAINSYGLTRLMSSVFSSKHPVGQIFRGLDWVINPEHANKFLQTDLPGTAELVHGGLTLQVEDFRKQGPVEGGRLKQAAGKVGELQQDLFEEPTLGKVVPAFKLKYAKETLNDLIKSGMDRKRAVRVAADSANSFFGGINVEELGRSKDFQNFLRSTALASDLITSGFRTGKGIVKGLTTEITNPEYKPYRRFAKNLALTVAAANVLNKAVSGHWMFQNEHGKEFELQAGKDANGKDRYIPIFGSAIDFLRLPTQVATAIASGNANDIPNIIRNRLSIPLGAATSLVSNTNAFGNPLVGKDKYGNQLSAGQTASNLYGAAINPFVPQQAQGVINAASGKQSAEQAIAGALELPVRYRTPAKVATKKGRGGKIKGRTIKGRTIKGRRIKAAKGRSVRVKKPSSRSRAIKALKV